MPNYRENTADAMSWRRAGSATIRNPLPGQGQGFPRIVFDEQDVVSIGGQVAAVTQVFGAPEDVAVHFDPQGAIAMIDPETGELTGRSMSHADLYAALHSLYMDAAHARDVRAIANAASHAP